MELKQNQFECSPPSQLWGMEEDRMKTLASSDNWFYLRRLFPCLGRWMKAMGALLIGLQPVLLNEMF